MLIQTLVRFDINCAEFGKNRTTCVVVLYSDTNCFQKVVASRRKKRSSKSWRRPGHARCKVHIGVAARDNHEHCLQDLNVNYLYLYEDHRYIVRVLPGDQPRNLKWHRGSDVLQSGYVSGGR